MVLLMLLVVVLRMLRVMLLVVLDRAGPRVVLRMVGWRWQALGRVGVMLVEAGTSAMSGRQQQRQRQAICKKKERRAETTDKSAGGVVVMRAGMRGGCVLRSATAICEGQGAKRVDGRQSFIGRGRGG
jgi:hypothetical protein